MPWSAVTPRLHSNILGALPVIAHRDDIRRQDRIELGQEFQIERLDRREYRLVRPYGQ
jgi:hypothetical protein